MKGPLTQLFTVRYISSACLVVQTTDVKILCDPWFTDGIYDGSWYTYPKVQDPVLLIGDVDYVYISHIHPDHYDPFFLRDFFKFWGEKTLLVSNQKANYLLKKASADGFKVKVIDQLIIGNTTLNIIPNETSSPFDVDSALTVNHQGLSFLNLNDNIFNPDQNQLVHSVLEDLRFAAIAFSPAGPYPHTYHTDTTELLQESNRMKLHALSKFFEFLNEYRPSAVLPFAGQYLLGGKLHVLNEYRGCSDAVELLSVDSRVVVLSSDTTSYYDLEKNCSVGPTRARPYPLEAFRERISEICQKPLCYETDISIDSTIVPMGRLIKSAYERAHQRSECVNSYYFFVQTGLGETGWLLSADRRQYCFKETQEDTAIEIARSQNATLSILTIDYRYLFGLLTGIYHWNNAEVGSHYRTHRTPNEYNRHAQRFLYNLNLF